MKFHHIGVACHNINEELASISLIHNLIDVGSIVYDHQQVAQLCLVRTSDGISIELVSGKIVASILKRKMSYYHLCFETDNIEAEIARLQAAGGLLVSELKEAVLFGNRKVAFLQVSYGLIELLQS